MAQDSTDDESTDDVKSEQGFSRWINDHWRPMMAMQYLAVCVFDFIIAPIGWAVLQAHEHVPTIVQWVPTTLGNGGMYHLAMGAVIGISAWNRTQEKEARGELEMVKSQLNSQPAAQQQ